MSDRTNPFHFGSPASGESFVDRQDELEAISDKMMNGQNIILLSPRRYGKTSLMLECIERVKAKRGRSGYASLLMCSSQREVAETLLTAVLNGPLSWMKSHGQKLGQVLGQVRPSFSVGFDPLGGWHADLGSAAAPERNWRDTISMVLRLLKDAGEGKQPVSLVLDEFQSVAEIDDRLPALFKVMADELRDVSLVFSGSKMHVMQQIATRPGAPLLGMGETYSLGPIPEDVMAGFLSRRARSSGKQLPMAVGRHIYQVAGGVPNDVQLLAYEAFAMPVERIDAAVVDEAMRRVISHKAIDYEETVTRLSPGQQRLLKALAKEPRSSLYSRAFMDEIDLANSTSVRRALEALEDSELVARRGEQWVVADTFLRGWLAANF